MILAVLYIEDRIKYILKYEKGTILMNLSVYDRFFMIILCIVLCIIIYCHKLFFANYMMIIKKEWTISEFISTIQIFKVVYP